MLEKALELSLAQKGGGKVSDPSAYPIVSPRPEYRTFRQERFAYVCVSMVIFLLSVKSLNFTPGAMKIFSLLSLLRGTP